MVHSIVVFLHTGEGKIILDALGVAFAFSVAMTLLKQKCGQKQVSLVFLFVSVALMGIFLFFGVTTLLDTSINSQAGLVLSMSSLI